MSAANQAQTGVVATNGTKLLYEVLGEGHPLVLLHGGYMDQHMWDEQFEVFAQHYKVIRYNIRGFGKSEMPQVPYSNVDDLTALLDHLNIKQTYLLGLSLGGGIALDFTLEYPEKVDALVLVGSSVHGFTPVFTPEQLESRRQMEIAFEQAIKERNTARLVDIMMQHPTLVPTAQYPAARKRVRENLSEYSWAFVLNPAPMQVLNPPAVERLTEIKIPTLILVGDEDDPVLHQMADKLEQDLPQTTRMGITETHHMPNIEKPAEFNQLVLDFLGKQ